MFQSINFEELMNKRNIKSENFKKFHPGGMLGKSLTFSKRYNAYKR